MPGFRGRPPKPTRLKILNGIFSASDGTGELQPLAGVPICPRQLDAEGKRCWQEIVKALGATGVLTKADRTVMWMFCEAFSQWRAALAEVKRSGTVLVMPSGMLYQSPYINLANRAFAQMEELGGKLGLDPSSRTRLKVSAAVKSAGVAVRDRGKGPAKPRAEGTA